MLLTYRVLHVGLVQRRPDLLISVVIEGVQVVPADKHTHHSWLTCDQPTIVKNCMLTESLPDCADK